MQGSIVDGVEPTFETIAAGTYPVSRPMYIYVKKAHVGVIPGIAEYVAEYTRPEAMGPEGYLTEVGLIPLPQATYDEVRQAATTLTPNVAGE